MHPSPQFYNIFIIPKEILCPLAVTNLPTLPPCPRRSTFCYYRFSYSIVCICMYYVCMTFRTNGIIQYVTLCDWLLFLNIIFSRFIHVVALLFFYGSVVYILSCRGTIIWLTVPLLDSWVPPSLCFFKQCCSEKTWTYVFSYVCRHTFPDIGFLE